MTYKVWIQIEEFDGEDTLLSIDEPDLLAEFDTREEAQDFVLSLNPLWPYVEE